MAVNISHIAVYLVPGGLFKKKETSTFRLTPPTYQWDTNASLKL